MVAAFNRLTIAAKLMAIAGASIGLLLLLAFSVVIFQTNGVVGTLTSDAAGAQAKSEANALQADLERVEAAAQSMAASVATLHQSGNRDRTLAMNVLKPNTAASSLVLGSWFFAEPNGWDGGDSGAVGHPASNGSGAFMPYWVKQEGGVSMEPNTEAGVYSADYYALAKASGKGAITDPYPYAVGAKTITMTSIAFPVVSGGRTIGVAGLDIALDDISKRLGALRPFGTGRVMLVSGSGMWVAHPDEKLRMKPYADAGLDTLKAALSGGETQVIDDGVEMDGEAARRIVTPIKLKGLNATWGLVMDVPEATISAPAHSLAWQLMLGGLLILGAVIGGLFLAARNIIARPMGELSNAVDRLAKGEQLAVPQCDRQDEIGTLARAADVFRQAAEDRASADARAAEAQKLITDSIGEGLAALSAGNLSHELKQPFPPEFEQLKTDFNGAVASLREAMTSIARSTGNIHGGSGEISQASDDLSRRTEQQAASLEETAAAMTEITTTVQNSAAGANEANRLVQAAQQDAQASSQVVGDAVAAMAEIEKSSQEIAKIIAVIDKIAFQTNLLALNASVEAAHAGEAGRAFAVVANEVRALAQRSADAAQEIGALISNSTKQVDSGVSLVGEAGKALERIIGSVGEISGLVSQIAMAADQQSSALAQVNTAIVEMDKVTQQNAAMVEESTAAARSLADEATGLAQLVGHFNVVGSSSRRAGPAAAPTAKAA
ncbi:MAG TPA: methyl-accepting chemotaxis protein [Allosphingosinicella sp.]|jgi:methyl-accepting chemotaxis protein